MFIPTLQSIFIVLCVITSYSIHYTKLYDISVDLPAPLAPIKAWLTPDSVVKSTSFNAFTPGNSIEIFFIVITSYSIHYTKLYDTRIAVRQQAHAWLKQRERKFADTFTDLLVFGADHLGFFKQGRLHFVHRLTGLPLQTALHAVQCPEQVHRRRS